MGYSLPGSSVHGISQARILELIAISFPGDSPRSVIKPTSPTLAGRFFTTEPPEKPLWPVTMAKILAVIFNYLPFLTPMLSLSENCIGCAQTVDPNMAISCLHLHSSQLLPWLLWRHPDRSPTSRAALLQSVCYTAARVVTLTEKWGHVPRWLKTFQWLPDVLRRNDKNQHQSTRHTVSRPSYTSDFCPSSPSGLAGFEPVASPGRGYAHFPYCLKL